MVAQEARDLHVAYGRTLPLTLSKKGIRVCDMEKLVKAWLTKYWATRGIIEVEGKLLYGDEKEYLVVSDASGTTYYNLDNTIFWCEKEARERVRTLATRELERCRKKTARFELIRKAFS